MKWYIASRQKNKELVKSIIKKINSLGHEVSFDWTEYPDLSPFENNPIECKKISDSISKELLNTDVFVMLGDEGGTDMLIELGIVLGRQNDTKKVHIYVVGKNNKRSLMHHHPSITHVDNIEDVFRAEGLFI